MSSKNSLPTLVVAISSRALFNLDESHSIYENNGVDAFCDYQIAHENDPLSPGVGYPLVKKLLHLNELAGQSLVDVVLLSRNSADTGLRVFNSIEHHGLSISRAAFTSGASPYGYVAALGARLFLSADPNDVREALQANLAAATLLPGPTATGDEAPESSQQEQLRIAFDGDAVIFSDEAEKIYKSRGLAEFSKTEKEAASTPLAGGPFKGFLSALHEIQSRWTAEDSPIRTALITARAAPAHERVIKTLRAWDIRIDEALFLGGMPKGEFLRAFGADIFFDDQQHNCENANAHVATGHVPHGIAND